MKLVLVYPPGWDSIMPPHGISSIKSYIKAYSDIEVKCYDLSIELGGRFYSKKGKKINRYIANILEYQPEIVGITGLDPTINNGLVIAKQIKANNRDIKIVFGGPQASYIGPEIFELSSNVDAVIKGEGEISFLEYIRANNGGRKKQLINGKSIEKLDEVPYPNFDDYSLDKYVPKILPITSTRGCTRRCTFCGVHANNLFGPYRERNPRNILAEIKSDINKYSVDKFLFTDAVMNSNPKLFRDICITIADSNINIKWGTDVLPSIRKKDIRIMSKSGCKFLWISPETGSRKTIKLMNKGVDLNETRETIKEAHNEGIFTSVWLILGFPGEGRGEIEETLNFARSIHDYADELMFVPFSLMRGSIVYKRPKEYGIDEISCAKGSIWCAFSGKNLIPEEEVITSTIDAWEEFDKEGTAYPFLDDYSPEDIESIRETLGESQISKFEEQIKRLKGKKPYSYVDIFKKAFD